MKALLIGQNAVAHALAEQISKSGELVSFLRYHNPGIAELSIKHVVLKRLNAKSIAAKALNENVDVAIVLSRTLIEKGLVDELKKRQIEVIGPTREQAKIDWDKTEQQKIFKKLNIPSPPTYVIKHEEKLKQLIKKYKTIAIKPIKYSEGKGTKFIKEKIPKLTYPIIAQPYIEGGKNIIVHVFTDGKNTAISPPAEVVRVWKGKTSSGYASYSTGENRPFLTEKEIESIKSYANKIANYIKIKGIFSIDILKTKRLYIMGLNLSLNDPAGINMLYSLNTQFMEIVKSIQNKKLKKPSFRVENTMALMLFPEGYPSKPKSKVIKINKHCLWNFGVKAYFNKLKKIGKERYKTMGGRALALITKGSSKKEIEIILRECANQCIEGTLNHILQQQEFKSYREKILP